MKKAIQQPGQAGPVKSRIPAEQLPLSELPSFLDKTFTLDVPVYTVWGACEDVQVLEKFRSGEYKVDKLHIIDEARSMLLEIGGVKLRLLGLGGAVVMHKLFDNGEGRTTIAGGQGTMWTTLLQMGELVDTANRVYDPTETRVFVTHASPAREGILNQLSVTLKADFSISAGLHFRYGSSYNEFSVNPTLDHYRGKLAASQASFNDVWETVKGEVEPAISQNEAQQTLLNNALEIVKKMPSTAHGGNPFGGPVGGMNAGTTGQVDESAFKNMWNFNLADAAFGWLVLEVQDGRIGTEMKAQGFNFAHRTGKQSQTNQVQAPATGSATPGGSNNLVASAPTGPAQTRSPIAQGPPQPFQGQPRSQQQQQPQPRGPPQPARSVPSPAPASQKSEAPQSAAVNLPSTKENDKTSTPISATNGTTPNGTATSPIAKAAPEPREPREAQIALFIMNTTSDDGARELFPEADRAKITKITKIGAANRAAHFKTVEERDTALTNLPDNYKTRSGDRSTPNVTLFKQRDTPYNNRQTNGPGAGTWGSARDGNTSGPERGYRSGGASDSENSRGGMRGGRGGPRGRGGDRGGRGARGGRGSFNNKATEGAAASPAPAAAPAASTPATDA